MRRHRWWIFCVSRQVFDHPGEAEEQQAACLSQQIQEYRAGHTPADARNMMWTADSPEWGKVVLGFLQRGDSVDIPPSGELRWKEQAESLRKAWRDAGYAWADDHPLAQARFRGAGSCRQQEVLELHLLRSCLKQGRDPGNPSDLDMVKKNLWADASQSLGYMASCSQVAPSLCRHSQLYDYRSDRVLLAEETLRIMGWSARAPNGQPLPEPQCCLAETELRDLVGESQAVQVNAVATAALLCAGRRVVPAEVGSRPGP